MDCTKDGSKLSYTDCEKTNITYDEQGNAAAACCVSYRDLDDDWQMFTVDVAKLRGPATAIFHGGYIDDSGNPESQYVFSRVLLY